MAVRVTNTGRVAWRTAMDDGAGYVRLGVQLLDAEQRLVNRDYCRVPLGATLVAGDTRELVFDCPPLTEQGMYHVKCDMVIEGVAWLEPRGSGTAVAAIEVT
jgi:hypothetical protein